MTLSFLTQPQKEDIPLPDQPLQGKQRGRRAKESKKKKEKRETHNIPIQPYRPLAHQPPSLLQTPRKTPSENYMIQPPFNLPKHHRSRRSLTTQKLVQLVRFDLGSTA